LIEEGVGVDDVCFVFFDDFVVCDVCRDCIVGKDKVFGSVAFGKGEFDVRCLGAVIIGIELRDFLVGIRCRHCG
jgi:hypothetical protein